jgi:ketosteroid isomerase-like protein
MAKVLILVGILMAGTVCGQSQDAPALATQATDQSDIMNSSRAWLEAYNRRDMATFATYIDDTYLGTTDDGILRTKEQQVKWLGERKPDYVQRTAVHDVQVHVDGDVAILSYRVTALRGWGGTTITQYLRRTEVFKKKDGKWLVIASHESLIPRNFFKALETDAQLLNDYVGQYDWPRHEAADRDTYTVENGHLISEWRGERKECLRMGKDTFFARDDNGWWTFARDADGGVTGYTYYYPDGQTLDVKKIR